MQSMAVALSAGSNANIGTNQSEKAGNESVHNMRTENLRVQSISVTAVPLA